MIVTSLALNLGLIPIFLGFIVVSIILTLASSNVQVYKSRYIYGSSIKLFIILSKSIITIYNSKIFIKKKDLAYFNKIKKYSKIYDHNIKQLEV